MTAVAITGLGLVTALGRTTGENARALIEGRTALAPARRLDVSGFRSAVVAEVPGGACASPARRAALTDAAWREAAAAAALDRPPPGTLVLRACQVPEPAWGGCPGGEDAFVSQACASMAVAICLSRDLLLAGLGQVAVVLGAAALDRSEYANMDVLRALSPVGARPFDVERDGTTLGEGGAAVVLERLDRAAGRGAAVLAVVAGAACAIDPRGGRAASSGEAIRDVVAAALDDAGVGELGYVHAHATGTPQGDDAELDALEAVAEDRGWHDVPVGSSKGALGHLLHASAAPGLLAAVVAFQHGVRLGTPGSVSVAGRDRVRVLVEAAPGWRDAPVLVNSFGFAGSCASLVLTPP